MSVVGEHYQIPHTQTSQREQPYFLKTTRIPSKKINMFSTVSLSEPSNKKF